jgi:hypothetical protein
MIYCYTCNNKTELVNQGEINETRQRWFINMVLLYIVYDYVIYIIGIIYKA